MLLDKCDYVCVTYFGETTIITVVNWFTSTALTDGLFSKEYKLTILQMLRKYKLHLCYYK